MALRASVLFRWLAPALVAAAVAAAPACAARHARPVVLAALLLNADAATTVAPPADGATGAHRHLRHLKPLYQLLLVVRDRASRVTALQVTSARRDPGPWLRFHRRAAVAGAGQPLWVRVRDRAGHVSRWRLVVPAGRGDGGSVTRRG